MTPPPIANANLQLTDIGNLNIQNLSLLEQRHEAAKKLAKNVLSLGGKWLSLGGGHDYGYPDGASFIESSLENFPLERPLVINFDAHLDVHPLTKGSLVGLLFLDSSKSMEIKLILLKLGHNINAIANLTSHGASTETQEFSSGRIFSIQENRFSSLSVVSLKPNSLEGGHAFCP